MRRNSIAAVILSICAAAAITFTGCGKGDIINNVRLEKGDITNSSIVIKVGNTGINYGEVKNYGYLLKCQYEGEFGHSLWKYSISDKETIGDKAKQEIVNMLTQLKVIGKNAESEDVTLSADEKDEAVRAAESIFNSASEKDREKYCLSVQSLTGLYEDNILANKMFYIATDEADTNISDEEARQIDIQYIEIMTQGIDRNRTKISMDDATKKEALKRAKNLAKEAKKAKNFLEFAQENTDSSSVELTIGKDSSEIEKSAVDMALSMKKGDISDVVQGENGYYIIYCVNDNNEDAIYNKKEQIIENRQTDMFKSKYAQWLKECDVSISDKFWDVFEL